MAHPVQDSSIYAAVALLKDNGLDGLAEAVAVLLNTAMLAARYVTFSEKCAMER